MADDLPLVPVIPERLRIAAREGRIVPFIGAGVSRLGGCPGWDEFANRALRFFVEKRHISHGEYEQLAPLSARVKLSMAHRLELEHQVELDFNALLTPTDAEIRALGEAAYADLMALGPVAITTNYDSLPDAPMYQATQPLRDRALDATRNSPELSRRVLYRTSEFVGAALDAANTVIHIHGSVRDRSSMVLSTANYLQRYSGHRMDGNLVDENSYLTFLEVLFSTRCVLFAGYGLQELEILEYVVQKARDLRTRERAPGQDEPRHYLLQGFFAHQGALRQRLADYYLRDCSIGLLPYSLEARGHEQLVDVARHLAQELKSDRVHPIQQRLEMEELLK